MKQTEQHDPLWDPAQADAELQHWQDRLAPYAAQRRALLTATPAPTCEKPVRRWPRRALALAASVLLTVWSAHSYRLYWPEGQAWQLQGVRGQTALAAGERLQTADDELAELSVARIGKVQIAPGSALRLLSSGSGEQRIELEHGRVHARIWAPPGHFGISSGPMRIIDLGCEFSLERQTDGRGSLSVQSGWVQQFLGRQEQLVPAGHALQFSDDGADTPLRLDAPLAMRDALAALDRALRAKNGTDQLDQLAAAVALAARDEDQYTLLSLLIREPTFANGPLYPRLALALRMPANENHRAAWLEKDPAAIETWWQRLPTQPKRWWTH